MLAARMIRGTYDPFQPGDIFSGRILLIATQAVIYKLAGIHIFTTQAGPVIIVILSCYLTVFKLLTIKNAGGTLIATSLFYFNPVITYLTVGITGDVYVMIAGIIICIILKSWVQHKKNIYKSLLSGTIIAFIIALSLLYKETILVFIPFVCVAAYRHDKSAAKQLVISLITAILFLISLYACFYYYYTGDAFFKISQIKNSRYLHHCSYDLLPFKYLLIRITYGVWKEFIVQGYYPVIVAAFISVIEVYRKRNSLSRQNINPVFFLSLFVICLYFPFSLQGYQPLCSDARQFILMLPFGVIVTTNFISDAIAHKNHRNNFILISISLLAICIISTGNKWQWMIYTLFSIYFIIILGSVRLKTILKYLLLAGILWLSILEHLFFKNSNWFHDMITLNKQIKSKYYYFPDHDNMMHWQLLHQFDNNTFAFYNLEKNPFKIFKLYYQDIDTVSFHPGWLLVNKSYTVRSTLFLKRIDSLQKASYFKRKIIAGDMSALMIDDHDTFLYLQSLIYKDEK